MKNKSEIIKLAIENLKNQTEGSDVMFFGNDPSYQEEIDTSVFATPSRFDDMPDSIQDDMTFRHVVVTTGIYFHPWYGKVSYTAEDLAKIAKNHTNNVFGEEVMAYQGHTGMGSRECLGVYSRSKGSTFIVDFNHKQPDGSYVKKKALIMSGYYTNEGFEKVKRDKTLRYVSMECQNNYKDRDISSYLMKKLKCSTVEECEKKIKEYVAEYNKVNPDIYYDEYTYIRSVLREMPSYGPVISAVAFTNEPFFHMPKILDIEQSGSISVKEFSRSNESIMTFDTTDSNLVMFDNDLYIKDRNGKFIDINSIDFDKEENSEIFSHIRSQIENQAIRTFSSMSTEQDIEQSLKKPSVNEQVIASAQQPSVPSVPSSATFAVGEAETQHRSNDGPRKQNGESVNEKTKNLLNRISSMTISELSSFDYSTVDDDYREIFSLTVSAKISALKAEENLAIQKNSIEAEKARYSAEIEGLKRINAENLVRNYSLSVDNFVSKFSSLGVPKSVLDTASEVLMSLDSDGRNAVFSIGDEKSGILGLVEKIFSKMSKEVFVSSSNASDAGVDIKTPPADNKSFSSGHKNNVLDMSMSEYTAYCKDMNIKPSVNVIAHISAKNTAANLAGTPTK